MCCWHIWEGVGEAGSRPRATVTMEILGFQVEPEQSTALESLLMQNRIHQPLIFHSSPKHQSPCQLLRLQRENQHLPCPYPLSMGQSLGLLQMVRQTASRTTPGGATPADAVDCCSTSWNEAVRLSSSPATPGWADNSLLSDRRAYVLS